jgi:hypothetical protein
MVAVCLHKHPLATLLAPNMKATKATNMKANGAITKEMVKANVSLV